jgi:phosphate/sulfate permease
VGILFVLAISDLVVGVSNDAVNFLNSAIGSKVASFKVIMFIAALGVIVGATFSSGMMEVARKGIMHPQYFTFWGVMVIFMAVMITDVILLDTFNTFGLPTSTTVSIVFELLGASVAVAVIMTMGEHIITLEDGSTKVAKIADLINNSKAMEIIGGILLSVVVAFSVGAIIMWITRLLFTYDYIKRMKRFGSIFGGIAITAITYFILIKGAKGAAFMSSDLKAIIKDNTLIIIGISFVVWTIILQVLNWIIKVDILKIVVFVGTFALAMAFAGNDLVNFIGVPIAGYQATEIFLNSQGADPNTFIMTDLAGKVPTPTFFLLLAGLIMVITLYTSKKAKSVVKTSIDLSRQDEGEERFGSSFLARRIVHSAKNFGTNVGQFVPAAIKTRISIRFDQSPYNKRIADMGADAPAFDMIRASVNLIVASILISFATSLKLPLSTTYVTFMVAMGTSLADKAWGRESAVYRITGVFSVIGGWFLTAFAAFTVAFIVAMIIYFGEIYAIVILIALAFYFIFRTHILHKKKEEKVYTAQSKEITDANIIESCTENVTETITNINSHYKNVITGLVNEDLKLLKKETKSIRNINANIKDSKDNVSQTLKNLDDNFIENGHYYVQVLDYLREVAHNMTFIVNPALNHVDNSHKGLLDIQKEELANVVSKMEALTIEANRLINEKDFDKVDNYIAETYSNLKQLSSYRKAQIKRTKDNASGTKNTMLYLTVLNETKHLTLHILNLVKAQRDFIVNNELD